MENPETIQFPWNSPKIPENPRKSLQIPKMSFVPHVHDGYKLTSCKRELDQRGGTNDGRTDGQTYRQSFIIIGYNFRFPSEPSELVALLTCRI